MAQLRSDGRERSYRGLHRRKVQKTLDQHGGIMTNPSNHPTFTQAPIIRRKDISSNQKLEARVPGNQQFGILPHDNEFSFLRT